MPGRLQALGTSRGKRQGCCIHGTHILIEEREKRNQTHRHLLQRKAKQAKGLGSNPSGRTESSLDRVIKDDLAKEVTTEKGTDRNETTRPIDIKWRKHNRQN